MIEKVEKGWGHELIFANKPEYCGKLLVFKKGKKFSLHYHMLKDETWYVAEGQFVCRLIMTATGGEEVRMFNKGESMHIPRGLPHQLEAMEDGIIFEVSTQHFDNDSYRIRKGD